MPERVRYPAPLVTVDHVEPVPRRVRAELAGRTVLDTRRARYLWEHPAFPQYYVPLADVDPDLLVDEDEQEPQDRGTAHRFGLRVGGAERPGAARVYRDDALEQIQDTVRLEWSALDRWFEEDDEVFVHPRSPYTRVDALRSSRRVRIEKDGVLLAESDAPVMVFETGLPPRTYLPKTAVRWEHLVPSDTVTQCPYKGRTSAYWSVRAGGETHEDLAWCYDFPTRQLEPVAGLVAFFDEQVDVTVDGERQERPDTPFS
ncbi:MULTISPECIES: DUF427 domain-containing protein [unclassified Modestobacter]